MSWPDLVFSMQTLCRQVHDVAMPAGTPYVAPSKGATEEDLRTVEKHLGHTLHPFHREFMKHANGWPSLSGAVSLLGANDFLGSTLQERAKKNLGYISGSALGPYRWKRRKLFPIGASDATLDVICMVKKDRSVLPGVIWFNNTEPDEYKDFEAYFRAILSYKPASIAHFSSRNRGSGNA